MFPDGPRPPAKYSGEKRCPLPDCPSDPEAIASGSTALATLPSALRIQSASHSSEEARSQSPLSGLDGLKSLPVWSPGNNGGNATIHTDILFCPLRTVLDLSLSKFTLCYTYSTDDMFAPATNPPAYCLTLQSHLLLSAIPIIRTAAPYVTIIDVLRGLYFMLRQPLSPENQNLVPQSLRPAVTQACLERGGTSLLHVDLLLDATKFTGLRRLVEDGCWEIMVK